MNIKNVDSKHEEEIEVEWLRIEQWMKGNAPMWFSQPGLDTLFNPPAPNESLKALEACLHQQLPKQLMATLLTHNGCQKGEYPLPIRTTRPTKWRTMSTAEIIEEWDLLSSVSANYPFTYSVRTIGPVQALWWSHNWIPIADCGMGDVICIDMAPTQGGAIGQLILYEHDFEERKVLYPSLLDCLRDCADDLENGEYVYMAGVGLCHKDDQEG